MLVLWWRVVTLAGCCCRRTAAHHEAAALGSVRGADGEVRVGARGRARFRRLLGTDARVRPRQARHSAPVPQPPLGGGGRRRVVGERPAAACRRSPVIVAVNGGVAATAMCATHTEQTFRTVRCKVVKTESSFVARSARFCDRRCHQG